MGIKSKLESLPAETLGGLGQGVSPLEMANAYATIASGGVRHRPTAVRRIVFPDGHSETPKRFRVKGKRAFPDWVTAKVTDILERNIQSGTGGKADIGCTAGGKTGTTDEHSDGWFVGFTPKLATAVWVGYPNENVHMLSEYHGSGVAGGTFPAEIWGDYMRAITRGKCGEFKAAKSTPQYSAFNGKYSERGGGEDEEQNPGPTVPQGPSPQDYGDEESERPKRERSPRRNGGGPDSDQGGNRGGQNEGGQDDGTPQGGEEFDPQMYESPPQGAPQTQSPNG
jgi:penicillin-binding protein 1A